VRQPLLFCGRVLIGGGWRIASFLHFACDSVKLVATASFSQLSHSMISGAGMGLCECCFFCVCVACDSVKLVAQRFLFPTEPQYDERSWHGAV
jgi:hypothetical protein